MLVSQMVRVMSQDPMSIAASGFGSTAPSVGSPGSMLPGSTDVPQPWQLLTGHAGGMIQIWGVVSHLLRPLMRIGQQAPPVTGLALCEPLGLVCSAHSGEFFMHGNAVCMQLFFCAFCIPCSPTPCSSLVSSLRLTLQRRTTHGVTQYYLIIRRFPFFAQPYGVQMVGLCSGLCLTLATLPCWQPTWCKRKSNLWTTAPPPSK